MLILILGMVVTCEYFRVVCEIHIVRLRVFAFICFDDCTSATLCLNV